MEIIATLYRGIAANRSREFIALLEPVDAHYPQAATITIVLDNHSSKETLAYLATHPGREYVHTPEHPWLYLIESACANDGACPGFRKESAILTDHPSRKIGIPAGISFNPLKTRNKIGGQAWNGRCCETF